MRLADRLSAARQRRFSGRAAETELFRRAVAAAELPFAVLYVHGPGGVGKTTLLAEFAAICARQGVACATLDARGLEPGRDALAAALARALEGPPGRRALLVDTYEALAPLDAALRDELLPQLPADTLVVLAGREPPALGWRADPGWQQLFRALPLRNLSPEESGEYLERSGVPADQRRRVLDFTRGHPLALSLVADLFAQRPGVAFQPEDAPDIIQTLLGLFVQKVPGPAHRAALEICALVHQTTEPLLAAVLGAPEAGELFGWLRSLSFVSAGRGGVAPHDLAREALAADLRWRNPLWYAELHRRARDYYAAQLQRPGAEQQSTLLDYIFLHRTNPVVRPFYEWQQSYALAASPAGPGDAEQIVELVARHEGAESARLAAAWLAAQPDSAVVLRDAGGPPAGALTILRLDAAPPELRAADPATDAAWRHLRRAAPLRPGQVASHFRFWMGRDTYQGVSPAQTAILVQIVRHYLLTPGLAYSFFPVAEPEFWAPLAAYADLRRIPEADFTVGGRPYGVYGRDWRASPPTAWLALLAEREVAEDALSVTPPAPEPPVAALSEPAFREAVREALQDFVRPDRLYASPLLDSRVVRERAGQGAPQGERAAALQRLLREACELLQASPRDARLHRAVHHTYLQPAGTQERAAELLDLPFSTYRRHLAAGVARVADVLWAWELGGA